MLKIYAVSILAVRMVKQKGKPMVETSHSAAWVVQVPGANVEELAMSTAHETYPTSQGYCDHTISLDEVSHGVARECVMQNENERSVSARQRPQQRLRQEPQWEEEEDLRIDQPEPKSRQWEPEDDRSVQGPRQWGAKRNGRSRR